MDQEMCCALQGTSKVLHYAAADHIEEKALFLLPLRFSPRGKWSIMIKCLGYWRRKWNEKRNTFLLEDVKVHQKDPPWFDPCYGEHLDVPWRNNWLSEEMNEWTNFPSEYIELVLRAKIWTLGKLSKTHSIWTRWWTRKGRIDSPRCNLSDPEKKKTQKEREKRR